MFLKNLSKTSWMQYNTGSFKVDIAAGATIEVSDAVGKIILKNLGAPNWVVETTEPVKEEPKKTVKKIKK